MKFYHYLHCPFCQRVRLVLSYKGIDCESVVLSYADSKTPESLIGMKMLPIINFEDGDIQPESLDLIVELESRFQKKPLFEGMTEEDFSWASRVAVSTPRYFDLLIPYMLEGYKNAPEFDEEGVDYFKNGKEAKRGRTFEALKLERFEIYEQSVKPMLEVVESRLLNTGFVGKKFSAADCVLVADLSGLRLVEGIDLPKFIKNYIIKVEDICGDDLLRES